MNLGAEPKKIAILAGLVAVGGYVFYANVLAGPDVAPSRTAKTGSVAVMAGKGPATAPPNIRRTKAPVRGAGSEEFRPSLKVRPEDRPNYATIDPTLRMDLLAKVQAVKLEGGARSLFQFSTPAVKPTEIAAAAIRPAPRVYGPEKPPPPVVPPPPPPPPPITLKFFGYSKARVDGPKRAFFMDGEDIFIAAEGELVKKRYRVVRIDANSVVMEDTEHKNNRQTIVLQQEQSG
jgi:hypothetical protein